MVAAVVCVSIAAKANPSLESVCLRIHRDGAEEASMNSTSWRKIAGWSGVLFVVVFVATSAPVADGPAIGDPADDVRSWLEESGGAIALTTWGGALSVSFLLLVFASGLRSFLGSVEVSSDGMWSRFSFAGAVIMAALGMSKAMFWAVLSLDEVRHAASDETLQTLAAFDGVAVATLVPWGSAAFLLGASIVLLQTGVMSKWLGWFGLSVVLAFAIGTLWLFSGDMQGPLGVLTLIGFLGFLVWTLTVAVRLIRYPNTSPEVSEAQMVES